MTPLKFIKIAVFVFSILLFVGSLFLASQIIKRIKSNKATPKDISLPINNNSKIKQISASDNILYILVSNHNKNDHIIAIDTQTGKQVLTINTD